jgi:hypothetical protein
MDDEGTEIWAKLNGDHALDPSAQRANWIVMWMPPVLAFGLGGAVEGYLRGWRTIRLTPFVVLLCVVAMIGTALWVYSFNRTRYRIDSESLVCLPGWPRRGWRAWRADVETLALVHDHGHWIMVLSLRSGGQKRRLVLTKSMRERLELR